MALIAIAADKGAPGVTTASIALAAVWPRPVLLAECDPSGGDLVYRLPAADGTRLDPRRGLLSLAVAARRGVGPQQVWEHAQKLQGGLDVLAGVGNAEQGMGVELLWGPVARVLAGLPSADVIADCGRIGPDGPIYDLLARADSIVLLSRPSLGEVIRLRDRVGALAAALAKRGMGGVHVDVVVVADYKHFSQAIGEVSDALRQSSVPARVVGGLAYEPKSADQLRGEWSGKLDKSMFIRTARSIASDLVATLPEVSATTATDTGPQRIPSGQQAGEASQPSRPPAPAGQERTAERSRDRSPQPQGQPTYGAPTYRPAPGQQPGAPGQTPAPGQQAPVTRPPYPPRAQPPQPYPSRSPAPPQPYPRPGSQPGAAPRGPQYPAPPPGQPYTRPPGSSTPTPGSSIAAPNSPAPSPNPPVPSPGSSPASLSPGPSAALPGSSVLPDLPGRLGRGRHAGGSAAPAPSTKDQPREPDSTGKPEPIPGSPQSQPRGR
jgi:hypothetical protein